AYDPDAKAPMWQAFLADTLIHDDGSPNHELIDWMRAFVGYSATGYATEQVLVINYGRRGANGKSVFAEVLTDIFAEVAQVTSFSTFEEKKGGGGIPNDMAALRHARLVVASEGRAGARMDEAAIKSATGNEKITARFLRQEIFSFLPKFSIMLATNHRPVFRGQDDALWRRVKLVEWKRHFKEHERDANLARKLLQEAPGILAWAVRGAMEWYANGQRLPKSATISAATEDFKADSDILGEYIREFITVTENPDDKLPLADVLQSYN